MKYFLVMNPASRGGKSRKDIHKILALFDECEIDYQYKHTNTLDHAQELSKQANESGYDIIVAVGGDGTINAVLNGFYDQKGNRISPSVMGVVHTGTSPDFCKSYGIPVKTVEAAQLLLSPVIKKITIGKITCCNDKSQDLNNKPLSEARNIQVKYFGCCANIGLGASLARLANSGIRKYSGDFLGTFLSLIKILFTFKPSSFTIVRDGEETRIDKLYNISIGRTYHIASGIKVRHELSDLDNRFYCLTTRDLNLLKIPSLLRQVYSGKPIKNSLYLSIDYCNSIEFFGNFQNPELEFDGDPAGFLPCKIVSANDLLDLITAD